MQAEADRTRRGSTRRGNRRAVANAGGAELPPRLAKRARLARRLPTDWLRRERAAAISATVAPAEINSGSAGDGLRDVRARSNSAVAAGPGAPVFASGGSGAPNAVGRGQRGTAAAKAKGVDAANEQDVDSDGFCGKVLFCS